MFSAFTNQLEMFDCTFDIYIGEAKQTQSVRAPRIMIQQQFMQLVQDAANDNRPIKVVMRRDVECCSDYSDKVVVRENSIEFKNNAYLDGEK